MMTEPRRALTTLRALLPSVIVTSILSLVGLVAARRLLSPALLRASNDVVGNYLQTLGTIYAVLLAFVVFVVWTQFNDCRAHVEREANGVLDLHRTAKGFPVEVRDAVHRLLESYVDAVLEREWPAMERGDPAVFEDVWRVVESLWDALLRYEPRSQCHQSLYDEVLARFNDFSDERTNRLSASRLKIPLALQILLRSGAALTIGSMYLFAVDSLAIHALMTAALAIAISQILYVIGDLDDCFAGDWQVPREPFRRVRRYMAAAAAAR